MTQRSCCVPNCFVKRGDDVLHHFPNPHNPAQIERFRTWVMKVGGDIIREKYNNIYNNKRVCHRHFEEVHTFPNKKLCALAIPSLHIPGVNADPHTVIVQDATMSLNPGVHADPHGVMVQRATVMQSTTDKDAPMSFNPGYRKNAKPATALEKELKNIITKTKLKLRKITGLKI